MTIKLEDLIPGGKADKLTVADIAKKHNTSIDKIEKQLALGMKVEKEHSNNPEKKREVALDHLFDNPNYYTKLKNAGLADELSESTNLTEMVGRIRRIQEESPKLNGITLKKGMKIRLKSSNEMLKNHYYEQFPEKYKKVIPTIAGTIQTIEDIYPTKAIESSNIKLVGQDLPIEIDDILKIEKRTI